MAFGVNIRRLELESGELRDICELDRGRFVYSISWGRDDLLALHISSPPFLYLVDAKGGTPVPITELLGDLPPDTSLGYPTFFPDGQRLLVSAKNDPVSPARIVVLDLEARRAHETGLEGWNAQHLAPNGVVYTNGGEILYSNLDPVSFSAVGFAQVLFETTQASHHYGAFSLSATGTLVASTRAAATNLVKVDFSGAATLFGARLDALLRVPRWSPDGEHLAYVEGGVGFARIWLQDRAGRARLPIESDRDAARVFPAWTTSDELLYFRAKHTNSFGLRPGSGPASEDFEIVRRGIAPGSAELVLATYETAMTPIAEIDRWLLYRRSGHPRLWRTHLDTGQSESWPRSGASIANADYSPRHRLLTVQTWSSGRPEVLVLPWPNAERVVAISVHGGREPAWSHDEQAIYFRWDGTLYRSRLLDLPSLSFSAPEPLFADTFQSVSGQRDYDPHPDGSGFVFLESLGESEEYRVVLGLQSLLNDD